MITGSHNNMCLVLSTSLGALGILVLASIVITVTIIIVIARRKRREANLIDEIYEDPDLIRYNRPPLPCRNIRFNDNQAYEKLLEMDENKAYTTGQDAGVNESGLQRSSIENDQDEDEMGPDVIESGVQRCSNGDNIRVNANLAYISRQAPGASESEVQNEGNQEDEMGPEVRESGERRGSGGDHPGVTRESDAPGGEQDTQHEYLVIIQ